MQNRFRITVLLAGAICLADEPAGPRILRPAGDSVLKPGPISIIAKTEGKGELRLDGKPLAFTQPATEVLQATVTPAEGMHDLTLLTPAGEKKLRFFMGAGKAPEGWKAFRTHPPAPTCDSCHAVAGGAWTVKGSSVGDNCFKCHDQKSFPKTHMHNTEVLAECQLCHNPHGSTEKAHLKMAKEIACKQCHG